MVTHTESYGMFQIPRATGADFATSQANQANSVNQISQNLAINPNNTVINGTLALNMTKKSATADVSSSEMAKNLLVQKSSPMGAMPRPNNVYAELLEIGEEIEKCRLRSC